MKRHSFTLIEILAAIGIIAILAALSVAGFTYSRTRSAEAATLAKMQKFQLALERYKKDLGVLPKQTTAGSIVLNETSTTWKALFKGNYLDVPEGEYLDGFGNPFHYQFPGTHNKNSYDLWSYGPDGKSSTAAEKDDDICNWKQN